MNSKNPRLEIGKSIKDKKGNLYQFNEGITKRLLEKYKCKMTDTIMESKDLINTDHKAA